MHTSDTARGIVRVSETPSTATNVASTTNSDQTERSPRIKTGETQHLPTRDTAEFINRLRKQQHEMQTENNRIEAELMEVENELKQLLVKYDDHGHRLEDISHTQAMNSERLVKVRELYCNLGEECDVMIKKFQLINMKMDDMQLVKGGKPKEIFIN